jgi:hypothetical protein
MTVIIIALDKFQVSGEVTCAAESIRFILHHILATGSGATPAKCSSISRCANVKSTSANTSRPFNDAISASSTRSFSAPMRCASLYGIVVNDTIMRVVVVVVVVSCEM